MRGITKFVGLTVLGCLSAVGIANADSIVYSFNATAVGPFGAGPFGSVTLSGPSTGTGDVLVTVSLNPEFDFVNTGGPHSVFAFNLTGWTGDASNFTGVSFASAGPGVYTFESPGYATPYGTFTWMLDCTSGCVNGAGGASQDPLTFTVANANLGMFTANDGGLGAYFASDVICVSGTCNGATGTIAAFGENPPHDVPEPGTLGLLGFGLAGLGFGLRRRRKI